MTSSRSTLRTALRLNAVLSAALGVLLGVFPSTVGRWLGVSIDALLRLLGIALVGHAAALLWCASRGDVRTWARANLAMIAPYPAVMIALVVGGLVERGLGRGLVLIDGAAVGAIALLHWSGLREARVA